MAPKNGKTALANMEQSTQAKRITLAEWRSNRIHERTLPSGLQVKIRDVSMTDLMFTGKLPDVIVNMAKDSAEKGGAEFDLESIAKNSADFNQMLNTLVELCLLEPKIGNVADDEHILLAELPADDKMDIFTFVNRGAEPLRPFREGEDEPAETA
jgi:hypothetical protein